MLADTVRRSLHGSQITYLRVALCPFDKSFTDAVPPAAREIRITGAPDTLDVAVTAVETARAVAGDRAVSGFSWADVERLAGAAGVSVADVLERLRAAGLDAIAHLPLDRIDNIADALDRLVDRRLFARAAHDRQGARGRPDGAAASRRGAAGAVRLHPGDQSAAVHARRDAADDRL